jgi:hypothetical protein
VTLSLRLAFIRFIATVLAGVLLSVSAGAGELFRYRLQTEDGREFAIRFLRRAPSPLQGPSPERKRSRLQWIV